MFEYLKSLVRVNSGDSSKSFGLVISAIVGGFIGLCLGAVILYDGFRDGILDTNLKSLGWFLMCDSIFIFGGGLGKIISEFKKQDGQAPE